MNDESLASNTTSTDVIVNLAEATAARHAAQSQLLSVIESMMDGNYDDAKYHLEKWNSMRLYSLECEGLVVRLKWPSDSGKSLNEVRSSSIPDKSFPL